MKKSKIDYKFIGLHVRTDSHFLVERLNLLGLLYSVFAILNLMLYLYGFSRSITCFLASHFKPKEDRRQDNQLRMGLVNTVWP